MIFSLSFTLLLLLDFEYKKQSMIPNKCLMFFISHFCSIKNNLSTENWGFSMVKKYHELTYSHTCEKVWERATRITFKRLKLVVQPVWLNGWVLVYEVSDFWFQSRSNHLNFRHCACFGEGFRARSGNYRV